MATRCEFIIRTLRHNDAWGFVRRHRRVSFPRVRHWSHGLLRRNRAKMQAAANFLLLLTAAGWLRRRLHEAAARWVMLRLEMAAGASSGIAFHCGKIRPARHSFHSNAPRRGAAARLSQIAARFSHIAAQEKRHRGRKRDAQQARQKTQYEFERWMPAPKNAG